MIEPTDEMELAFNRAAGLDGDQYGAGSGIRVRDGLAAVLQLIARDHCLERRSHVFHPLDKGAPLRKEKP